MSAEAGAGRTFVARGLFTHLSINLKVPVQLAGFDIEKPDLLALFPENSFVAEAVYSNHPVIGSGRCNFCGNCARSCLRGALHFDRFKPAVSFDPSGCYVCAECLKACARQSIKLEKRQIGRIHRSDAGKASIMIGELSEHCSLQVPLLQKMIERLEMDSAVIADISPGSSLQAVLPAEAMDAAIIVVPGKNRNEKVLTDLLALLSSKNVAAGFLFNRSSGDAKNHAADIRFCARFSVPLLGFLPEMTALADNSNNAGLIMKNFGPIFTAVSQLSTKGSLS